MEHDDDPEKRIAELERRHGRPVAQPPAPQPGWRQQTPSPYAAPPQSGWQQMYGFFRSVDFEAQWTPPDQRHHFRTLSTQTSWLRRFNVVFTVFVVLGLPLLIGVVATFNARGSTASFTRLWMFILAMVLGGLLIFAVIVLRQQRLSKRMSELATALGGIATRDRLPVMLDWLDRHWPWPTKTVILWPGNMRARRWCAAGVYAGLHVLVAAQRFERPTPGANFAGVPKIHRTDIFIAGGRVRWDTTGDLQRVAAAHGFEVTGTEAGVHCFRRDAQVSALDAVPDILAAARPSFAT